MAENRWGNVGAILLEKEAEVIQAWAEDQGRLGALRPDLLSHAELRQQCAELLAALREGLARALSEDLSEPAWEGTRALLKKISLERARRGFSPSETAGFIFALRRVLLEELRKSGAVADDLSAKVMGLVDRLGLFTFEVYVKGREEVITRQQQELMELSTPVVQLWDGILALPLIGVLDSARTQVVMESLLQRIVETGSSIAIIDITGVPAVDTLVAQHLIKTVAAARLMGADCIISGIRPQIAQTIVHLGISLSDVPTKATLADAFRLALGRVQGTLGGQPKGR